MACEDMEQRMKQMARFYFSGYEQYSHEDIIKKIEKISIQDLYDFINNIKINLKKSLIIYGPKIKSSDKKIILKDFEDVQR